MLSKLCIGPMTSGKSTELHLAAKKKARSGAKVIYINSEKDTRSDEPFSTHNDLIEPKGKGYDMIKVSKLAEANVDNYDYVLVDESHFFNDLDVTVRNWVDRKKKIVIVGGLSGDIDAKLIGQTHLLMPIAEEIVVLKAHCLRCVAKGVHWEKAIASRTILKGADDRLGQFKVGGTDEYEAVCPEHFNETKEKERNLKAST